MSKETKAEFVEDGMYEFTHTFNSAQPEHKRVKKKKDFRRVEKGLDRGYDMREEGKDAETIRATLKKEVFGSFWIVIVTFIWANYRDEIIEAILAFIIKRLFPTPQAPPFSTEG